MSETRMGSRRRRSDHPNLLYAESSLWGVYAAIVLVILVFGLLLALYFVE